MMALSNVNLEQGGVDALLAMETADSCINLPSLSHQLQQQATSTSISVSSCSVTSASDSRKRKKKSKKSGKKNKPKKAMTPFMVFSKETRKLLVAENPALTFSEIGKELGKRWRNLDDSNKEIYVIKANQDYQRFLDETEQLEAQNPCRKRKTTEQKKQTKVKKSISAYLYFCNAHREQVKHCHPTMKMVEIQRLLAEKWMNSPNSIKIPFEKQAEADREKYNSDIQVTEQDGEIFGIEVKLEGMGGEFRNGNDSSSAFFTLDAGLDGQDLLNLDNDAFGALAQLGTMRKSESVENLQRILGLNDMM